MDMATKTDTKVAKVETKGITPDAVGDAGMVAKVAAALAKVDEASAALSLVETSAFDSLVAAHRTFGDAVRDYAATLVPARTTLGDWSAIRGAIFPKTKTGTGTLAGRSEASLRRSIVISFAIASDKDLAAYRQHRGKVLAAATKDDASQVAKDAAKVTAYESEGIVALVSYGDAKLAKRLNTTTGVITGKGSNRTKSDAVVARNAKVTDVVDTVATLHDPESDDDTRADAMLATVVPGITVGMLDVLSADHLTVLAAVATKMAKVKRETKSSPVPPVLETTAPTAPEVSVETLAAIDHLRTLGILIPTA
jgi:hypothetical protein